MALRLVLVGIVAGLGLTIPSRNDVNSWSGAAESWMNARLAEWDARHSIENATLLMTAESPAMPALTPVVTNELTKSEMPVLAIAPLAQISRDESRVPVPVVVADDEFAAVVDAMAATFILDLEPTEKLTAPSRLVLASADVAKPEEASLAIDQTAPSRDVIAANSTVVAAEFPVIEAIGTTEAVEDETTETTAPLVKVVSDLKFEADLAFRGAMDEVVNTFNADLAATNERAAADAAFVAVVEEMAEDFGAEMIVLAESQELATPTANETLKSAVEQDVDLVVSDPVAVVPVDDVPTSPNRGLQASHVESQEKFSTAVRLTREAVFAWAKLLHGPAIVTISR